MNKKLLSKIIVSIFLLSSISVFGAETTSISPISIHEHGLVIKNGDVYSWGNNSNKQAGVDTSTTSFGNPIKVEGIPEIVVSVAAGSDASVALTITGEVYVWGSNSNGFFTEAITSEDATPRKIEGLPPIKSLHSTYKHILAITTNGDVYAWGKNEKGESGQTTGETTLAGNAGVLTPKKIEGLSDVVDVAAGNEHSLFLTSKGTVYGMGANNQYQLLPGGTLQFNTPQLIPSLVNIVDVAAGYGHSMALSKTGEVYTWGTNTSGALGTDANEGSSQSTPTKVNLPEIAKIAAGARGKFSAAIATNGDLYVWGSNTYGELGTGDTTNQLKPVKVETNVKNVSINTYNILIEKEDGSIWVSGRNNKSQKGDDNSLNFSQIELPVQEQIDGSKTSVLTVDGRAQATMIRAEVPLSVAFEINPNAPEEKRFISPIISVKSLTNAPLKVELVKLSKGTEGSPTIIDSSTYTDEQWDELGTRKTHSEIALGVKSVNDSFEAFYLDPEGSQTPQILSSFIKKDEKLDFELMAKYGLSWKNTEQFNYNLELKLSLID